MGDNGDAGMVRIPGLKGNVTGDTAGAVGIGTALSIKTKSLSNGKKGKSYSDSLALGGKKPVPVKWTAFGLPPGLTLDASSGKLAGTPTATGSFTVLVLVVAKSGRERIDLVHAEGVQVGAAGRVRLPGSRRVSASAAVGALLMLAGERCAPMRSRQRTPPGTRRP